jgi:hypothetical protein
MSCRGQVRPVVAGCFWTKARVSVEAVGNRRVVIALCTAVASRGVEREGTRRAATPDAGDGCSYSTSRCGKAGVSVKPRALFRLRENKTKVQGSLKSNDCEHAHIDKLHEGYMPPVDS